MSLLVHYLMYIIELYLLCVWLVRKDDLDFWWLQENLTRFHLLSYQVSLFNTSHCIANWQYYRKIKK